jgi:hypothetical protein
VAVNGMLDHQIKAVVGQEIQALVAHEVDDARGGKFFLGSKQPRIHRAHTSISSGGHHSSGVTI